MPRIVTMLPTIGDDAAGALDVVDRRERHVVVDDRADALHVARRRADDVGDVDEERLVWLEVTSPLTVTSKL